MGALESQDTGGFWPSLRQGPHKPWWAVPAPAHVELFFSAPRTAAPHGLWALSQVGALGSESGGRRLSIIPGDAMECCWEL